MIARSTRELRRQEIQHLPDDPARGLAVVQQIEQVRAIRVVHQSDWPVQRQRSSEKAINRVVQVRELLLARADDEQRQILAEIVERLSCVRIGEAERGRRLRDAGRASRSSM